MTILAVGSGSIGRWPLRLRSPNLLSPRSRAPSYASRVDVHCCTAEGDVDEQEEGRPKAIRVTVSERIDGGCWELLGLRLLRRQVRRAGNGTCAALDAGQEDTRLLAAKERCCTVLDSLDFFVPHPRSNGRVRHDGVKAWEKVKWLATIMAVSPTATAVHVRL